MVPSLPISVSFHGSYVDEIPPINILMNTPYRICTNKKFDNLYMVSCSYNMQDAEVVIL